MNLPPAKRLEATRRLEKEFQNPDGIDVFTEEEAGYNASLLRQKGIHASEEEAHHDLLDALYHKAKRTVELLSEHLLLSKLSQEELGLDPSLDGGNRGAALAGSSIVLRHDDYNCVGVETVILLLLRCKKLYEAL